MAGAECVAQQHWLCGTRYIVPLKILLDIHRQLPKLFDIHRFTILSLRLTDESTFFGLEYHVEFGV